MLWKKISFILLILFLPVMAHSASYREQDKKCMEECHGKDNFYYTPASNWGNLQSLYVNYDKFLKSKHGIFTCLDCHPDADAGEKAHFPTRNNVKCESCHGPESLMPENIKKVFQEKGIKVPDNKKVYGDYVNSLHGKAYYQQKRNAPYCTGCHDPHNANKNDKDFPVSLENLPQTCGKCHPSQARLDKTIFSKLALFRINGHQKGDSSTEFSPKNCISCHQGDSAHGKRIDEHVCMDCHKRKSNFLASDFHGNELPGLAILMNFGLLFGIVLVGGVTIAYKLSEKVTKKE